MGGTKGTPLIEMVGSRQGICWGGRQVAAVVTGVVAVAKWVAAQEANSAATAGLAELMTTAEIGSSQAM